MADKAKITGTVLDLKSGKPVKGARVTLAPSARTDDAGKFVIEDVPLGVYTVVIEADGYAERRAPIEINDPLDLMGEFAILGESAQ